MITLKIKRKVTICFANILKINKKTQKTTFFLFKQSNKKNKTKQKMMSKNTNGFSGFYFDDNPSDEFMPFNNNYKVAPMPVLSQAVLKNKRADDSGVYLSSPFLTYYLEKVKLTDDESDEDFVMHGPKKQADFSKRAQLPDLSKQTPLLITNENHKEDTQSVLSNADTSDMSISDLGSAADSSRDSELTFDAVKSDSERDLSVGQKQISNQK